MINCRGQSTIFGLWSLLIVGIGILLIGSASYGFLSSQVGNDQMVNFLISFFWFFVIIAGIFGFFAFRSTVTQ